jgi:hypothetical protein
VAETHRESKDFKGTPRDALRAGCTDVVNKDWSKGYRHVHCSIQDNESIECLEMIQCALLNQDKESIE